jgi:hypothetical protein
MRFPLLLLASMILSVAWQPAAFADLSFDHNLILADDTKKDRNEDGTDGSSSDEEPECE